MSKHNLEMSLLIPKNLSERPNFDEDKSVSLGFRVAVQTEDWDDFPLAVEADESPEDAKERFLRGELGYAEVGSNQVGGEAGARGFLG